MTKKKTNRGCCHFFTLICHPESRPPRSSHLCVWVVLCLVLLQPRLPITLPRQPHFLPGDALNVRPQPLHRMGRRVAPLPHPHPHPLHLPSLQCADRLSLFQDRGVSKNSVGQFGALMRNGCFRSDHNTFPRTKVFVNAPQVQTSCQKSGSYQVCLHSVGKSGLLRTKLPRNLPPQAPRR